MRIHEVLREGAIVTADDDPQATLDEEWHEQDLELLVRLGLGDKPHPGGGSQSEGWFDDYRRDALSEWRQAVRALGGGNPQEHLVQFEEQVDFGPLAPLMYLSDEARVRFTRHVLPFVQELTGKWNLGHTQPKWPKTTFESPTLWMIKQAGRLETSLGIRSPKDCVGTDVGQLADAFPVADIGNEQVALLGLPNDPGEFGEQIWTEAISRADQVSDELIGALYGLAASHGQEPPENIHCLVGDGARDCVPPEDVVVVTDESELEGMLSNGCPCLLSSTEDAEVLVARWGLSRHDPSVRFEIECQISRPEMLLVEEYPGLKQHLDDTDTFLISIQCSSLDQVAITDSGANPEPHSMLIDDDRRVYWHEDLSREDFLRLLNDHLELGLDDGDIRNVLDEEARAPRRRLVQGIRRKKRFESKLLHVVPAESIRRHMPAVVLQVAEEELGELDDTQVVELARACFGPRLLAQLRAEFEQAGLEPPNQFAGGRAARVWVEELGFPREYAGFESASREPLLEIEGPPDLPPLHDYQEQVKTSMQQLLRESAGNRGLLCLPTGAGKTRVAVQSLVELIREGELGGPILWVAQTDELCEQAVQTWSEIWRAEGSDDRLALSRLWSRNEVQERADQPQVVVATIAKLDVLDGAEPGSGTDEYGWLAEASCVIVDEAHRALGPSYNRLLRWLQLDRNRKTRNLIGLTATPFRGTDETATEALVRRFQRRRIDSGVFMDPYRELQELGFLAKTKHKKLKGRTIDLSPDELDHLNKFRALPRSAEKRVGDDRVRNRAIIRSIGGLDEDWPVLVFAASVAHAQALAAILSLKGITAAAITSQTSAGARRYQIEQFRSGTLRVLTNYAVLTEGFDAPKIRALYITRPTYSPNLYQQMIGRGLRGPMNGGSAECLIVDVEDNIAMYEGQLAFNEFEGLWS
jgi:superfamily II DNA or RNA helicase